MKIGMERERETPDSAPDFGGIGSRPNTEHASRMVEARRGRGDRRRARALAGPAASRQKLAGLKRSGGEHPGGNTPGHVKRNARVDESIERRKSEYELLAKRGAYARLRDRKVANEHLAQQALRGHCAQQRPLSGGVVDGTVVAEQLSEEPAGAIERDGRDFALSQVNAVGAPARFFREFERAGRRRAMKGAQQIAERRGAQATGELHPPAIRAVPFSGQV